MLHEKNTSSFYILNENIVVILHPASTKKTRNGINKIQIFLFLCN